MFRSVKWEASSHATVIHETPPFRPDGHEMLDVFVRIVQVLIGKACS